MSFMGWSAELRGGTWYAVKMMERADYGSAGAVWVRKVMPRLAPTATKREADREIVRMYRAGVLN